MPAQYERIRDAYVARGKNYDEAQRLAAMTYNARHPGHAMRPEHRAALRSRVAKRLRGGDTGKGHDAE